MDEYKRLSTNNAVVTAELALEKDKEITNAIKTLTRVPQTAKTKQVYPGQLAKAREAFKRHGIAYEDVAKRIRKDNRGRDGDLVNRKLRRASSLFKAQ